MMMNIACINTITNALINHIFNKLFARQRRDCAKGAPSSSDPAAWLDNPQFMIWVREKTSCVIVLSQPGVCVCVCARVRACVCVWRWGGG